MVSSRSSLGQPAGEFNCSRPPNVTSHLDWDTSLPILPLLPNIKYRNKPALFNGVPANHFNLRRNKAIFFVNGLDL